MKTKTLVLRHWEDVVFENRNKAYGAYVLRREYSKRVILGWGVTMALLVALLYLPDVLLPETTLIRPPKVVEGILQILPPPPLIPPRETERPRIEQPRTTTTSSQIVVTTDIVETTVEPVEGVASTPDVTGEGGAVDGYVDGTIAAPVAEPAVVAPPVVRDFAEVMPEYVGGYAEMMKYIQRKTRYPGSARRLGIFGSVFVRFIVRPDGKITDVEVIRGVSKDCDAEAARVISSMPNWTPASQNGIAVPVRIVVPIKFSLE